MDLNAFYLGVILGGASLGPAIHLGGALWYTRRQRIRFEQDVTARLATARTLITADVKASLPDKAELKSELSAVVLRETSALPVKLELELGKMRAEVEDRLARVADMIPTRQELGELEGRVVYRSTAAIQGWWGQMVEKTKAEAKKAGMDPGQAQEYAELSNLFGKEDAGKIIGGWRLLEMYRARRLTKQGKTPPGTPQNPATQAPNLAAGAPVKRGLDPRLVEALEEAGFKRADVPALTDGTPPPSQRPVPPDPTGQHLARPRDAKP